MYYTRLVEKEIELKLRTSGAVGGAYQREDGVFVAPINLLKP